MRFPRRDSQPDILSRYWNARVAAATSEMERLAALLDPADLATIERISALRVWNLPDPAFVDRLERDSMRAFSQASAQAGPTIGRTTAAGDASHPGVRRRAPVLSPDIRRWVIAEIVVAVTVVIIMAIGFRVFDDEPRTTILAPTQPPAPTITPVSSPPDARTPEAGLTAVNADGAGLTILPGEATDVDPVWSPDGRRIAFAGKDGIYIMNAGGSERTLIAAPPAGLTGAGGFDPEIHRNPVRAPAWSPDGNAIAFAAATGAIYVVGVDGTGLLKIADPGERNPDFSFEPEGGYAWRPAWSPDSDRLAIVSGYGPTRRILLVEGLLAGDPTVTTLVDLEGDITGPSWSPSGDAIAFFVTNEDAGGLYLIRPGGEPRRLTDIAPNAESLPSWSPDGARVIYAAMDGVWAAAIDGSTVARVTGIPRGTDGVTWSPAGDRIAFVAVGYPYLVRLDGTGLIRLVNARVDAAGIVWSSDGEKLIFRSQ